MNNKEISELKQILGLQQGKDYTDAAARTVQDAAGCRSPVGRCLLAACRCALAASRACSACNAAARSRMTANRNARAAMT